jgi:hypothetical protein
MDGIVFQAVFSLQTLCKGPVNSPDGGRVVDLKALRNVDQDDTNRQASQAAFHNETLAERTLP